MTSTTTLSLDDCVKADAVDPLREFRREFAIPEGVLYFDGNSLGARPIAAQECAARVIGDEWGNGLVRSWNEAGWFDLPVRLGDKLAPLLGAGEGEVVVTDSTSINLFKALASALSIAAAQDPSRKVIVSERYLSGHSSQRLMEQLGCRPATTPRSPGRCAQALSFCGTVEPPI